MIPGEHSNCLLNTNSHSDVSTKEIIMNDDDLKILLTDFLLYMMENGVTFKYKVKPRVLRDEFIAQLNKPAEDKEGI